VLNGNLRFLIALLLINSSCSSIRFNYKLIEPWTSVGQENEPYQSVFIARFQKSNKSLNYIAANHINSLSSPTFKTIKKAIHHFSPSIIILEGFSSDQGISPEKMVIHSDSCYQSQFSDCSESAYAIHLAQKSKISFIGAEPSDKLIMKEMIKKNYTGLDIAGFYLLRQIPQLRRQARLKSIELFPEQAESYLKSFSKHLGKEGKINYDLFLSWYKDHNKTKKSFYSFDSSDAAPIQDGSYFQQISSEIGFVREKAINQIIEEKIHEYSNVLVIYGAGHLVKSRKLYEDYFGKAEHIKWF